MNRRLLFVIGFSILCLALALLLPAMPQPPGYHDFADRRVMFGFANFADVASNVGFALAGLTGIVVVLHRRTAFEFPAERWPYAVFFLGVLLTAAGSAYYHLAPDNPRLFWDRLPMTVAFMALVCAQVVDRVDVRTGLLLLVPALLLGASSVIYWRATENAGWGNVLPYGVLQAYAGVILLMIAMLYPSRYTRGTDIYWALAAYAASKVFEALDDVLFDAALISGHTLKHLAAAVAGLVLCRMLWLRTLREQRTSH
jgi:hypothetical protein